MERRRSRVSGFVNVSKEEEGRPKPNTKVDIRTSMEEEEMDRHSREGGFGQVPVAHPEDQLSKARKAFVRFASGDDGTSRKVFVASAAATAAADCGVSQPPPPSA